MKRNNIGLVLFCSISHFLKKFKIYKMAASWKGEYENTIDGGFLWEDKIPVSHLDNLKLNLLDRLSVRRKCKGLLSLNLGVQNDSSRLSGLIFLRTTNKISQMLYIFPALYRKLFDIVILWDNCNLFSMKCGHFLCLVFSFWEIDKRIFFTDQNFGTISSIKKIWRLF